MLLTLGIGIDLPLDSTIINVQRRARDLTFQAMRIDRVSGDLTTLRQISALCIPIKHSV